MTVIIDEWEKCYGQAWADSILPEATPVWSR